MGGCDAIFRFKLSCSLSCCEFTLRGWHVWRPPILIAHNGITIPGTTTKNHLPPSHRSLFTNWQSSDSRLFWLYRTYSKDILQTCFVPVVVVVALPLVEKQAPLEGASGRSRDCDIKCKELSQGESICMQVRCKEVHANQLVSFGGHLEQVLGVFQWWWCRWSQPGELVKPASGARTWRNFAIVSSWLALLSFVLCASRHEKMWSP
jgi:hypothetical protein